MAGCGADTDAKSIYTSLTDGTSFPIPTVSLEGPEFQIPTNSGTGVFGPISKLTNADLTTGDSNGSGTFDALMKGFDSQLRKEWDEGRITGAQYAEAYVQLTQSAMSAAVQYLLGRDAAYWNAVQVQLQAQATQVQVVQARVELQIGKTRLAQVQNDALNAQANYALTKMKLSGESINYCIGQYNLSQMLPAQKALLSEQLEAQRAQTLDTRLDGGQISGMLGIQKRLYSQQIESYKRASETSAAKIFTDAWITMKTIDEGLVPPNAFTNANLDVILSNLKTNNAL